MPGIDPERFVNSLPDEILCSICCHVINRPVAVSCGHLVCSDCWTGWVSDNKSKRTSRACPCCLVAYEKDDVDDNNNSIMHSSRQDNYVNLIWKLIQQFDVYCRNFGSGCTVVTKLELEDYHLRDCPFEKSEKHRRCESDASSARSGDGMDAVSTTCDYCKCTIEMDSDNQHNCWLAVKELVKRQTAQLTNLGFENEKLSLELIRKENDLLDNITDLESENQRRALDHQREVNELRQQLSSLTQLKTAMQAEDSIHRVVLHRSGGSLGFNIIGGHESEGNKATETAIMVSRVMDEAVCDNDQQSRLKVHDRILEVNGINLRGVTHAKAVSVIKATSDPVEIVVARKEWLKPLPVNQCTQTISLPSSHCHGDQTTSPPRLRRSRSLELTDSANLSCSDDGLSHMASDGASATRGNNHTRKFTTNHDSYDSAYDTLMTNRSARSLRSPSSSSQGDEERPTTTDTIIRKSPTFTTSSTRNDSELSASSVCEDLNAKGTRMSCSEGQTDDPASQLHQRLSRLSTDDASNGSSCSAHSTKVEQRYPIDLYGGSSSCGETDGYEYECKRVTLFSPERQFGVYFCLGGDDVTVSVFIGEIDDDSPADRETDIAVGDLVLEINGESVSDIEAAYEALQNNDKITLLVARPVFENIQENFLTETEDEMLATLHEVESEEDVLCKDEFSPPLSPFGIGRGCPPSNTTRPRASTDTHREPSTVQYAEQVQRAAKEMFARNERIRSASMPAQPESLKPSKNTTETKSKHTSRKGDTRESSNSNRRRTSSNEIDNRNGKVTGTNDVTSPKPRRSALKTSHSSSKDNDTKQVKHVRVDPKGDWTATEKKIWEEFKLIQSYEAEANQSGAANLDTLEKQWSVKRSKDGEHIYIRKKLPIAKSKLLKNRGQRVSEERKGITTDDDAMSVYLGRYWNRDERRRQLGRNKEKKKRLIDRLATLTELQQPRESEKKMTEIVQKRMTSDMNWTDGFVTIQEILAQRNRDGTFNGLVHVTTV